MAKSEFVFQGFTASTHGEALRRLFDCPNVESVLVSVAFATEAGVSILETHLAPYSDRAKVFVGIRNDTTSYQALIRLHGIATHLFAVDTGSRTVIFHPKIYLVRGSKHARLLIGSANLTLGGLNNNIEAGMLVEFDLENITDKSLVDETEKCFVTCVAEYPNHIVRVGGTASLDEMLSAGRLVDELDVDYQDISESGSVSKKYEVGADDADHACRLPRIDLKVKALQTGILKGKAEPNKALGRLPTKTLPSAVGVSLSNSERHVEAEPSATDSSALVRQVSRRGDGPRIRARRAKLAAKKAGKKWYFTGDPCIYGHFSDRLVSNGKCRECNRLDSEQSNRLGLYR